MIRGSLELHTAAERRLALLLVCDVHARIEDVTATYYVGSLPLLRFSGVGRGGSARRGRPGRAQSTRATATRATPCQPVPGFSAR